MIKLKKVHISIDDCTKCFRELYEKEEKITSIFEIPLFKILHNFNKKYGLKVTLYCWSVKSGFKISSLSERFKDEFTANSDWLKMGFHSSAEFDYLSDGNLGRTTEMFCETVADFQESIERIAGKQCISSIIRLHYYSATNDEVRYLKDLGVNELLTSHDSRISYDLTEMQQEYIEQNGSVEKNDVRYVKSDLCIDLVDDIEVINNLLNEKERLTLFSHEIYFQRDKEKWEKILEILLKNKCEFIA